MKKALLLTLSIAIVLSVICIPVVANDFVGHEARGGETVTVIFKLPDEYTNIKSGALSYSFDEGDLEYVEGSAKWLIPSLLIKDVDTEKKNAIFAFASEQTISGDVFTMAFKLREGIPCDTNLKINVTLNLNQGEHIVHLYDVIFVVEEHDDPTTPADFATAVGKIDVSADSSEDAYIAITEALEKYNALTPAEKEEAAADYAKLLDEIHAYNNLTEVVNQEAQSTLEVAFSAISNMFAYLSRLLKAFVQVICF
jgi:hypothetical protein